MRALGDSAIFFTDASPIIMLVVPKFPSKGPFITEGFVALPILGDWYSQGEGASKFLISIAEF